MEIWAEQLIPDICPDLFQNWIVIQLHLCVPVTWKGALEFTIYYLFHFQLSVHLLEKEPK